MFLSGVASLVGRIATSALVPRPSFFPRYPSHNVQVEILLLYDDTNLQFDKQEGGEGEKFEEKNHHRSTKWQKSAVERYKAIKQKFAKDAAFPGQNLRISLSGASLSSCSGCREAIRRSIRQVEISMTTPMQEDDDDVDSSSSSSSSISANKGREAAKEQETMATVRYLDSASLFHSFGAFSQQRLQGFRGRGKAFSLIVLGGSWKKLLFDGRDRAVVFDDVAIVLDPFEEEEEGQEQEQEHGRRKTMAKNATMRVMPQFGGYACVDRREAPPKAPSPPSSFSPLVAYAALSRMVLGVAPIHRKKKRKERGRKKKKKTMIKAASSRVADPDQNTETRREGNDDDEEEEEEEEEDLLLATSGVKNGPFPLQVLESVGSFAEKDAAWRLAILSEFEATTREVKAEFSRLLACMLGETESDQGTSTVIATALVNDGGDAKKWTTSKLAKAEKAFLASLKSDEKLSFLRRWNVYKFKIERTFQFLGQLNFHSSLALIKSAHHDVRELRRVLLDSEKRLHCIGSQKKCTK